MACRDGGPPVASPGWWREAVGAADPSAEPAAPKRKRPTPVTAGAPSGGGAALVDALVASDLYRRRRDQNKRARLDDERVKFPVLDPRESSQPPLRTNEMPEVKRNAATSADHIDLRL